MEQSVERGEPTMKLRDVIVHVDASPAASDRLDYAAEFARRHDAHLTALYVVDVPVPAVADFDGALMAQLMEQQRTLALAEAGRVAARVAEVFRREQLRGGWLQVEGYTPEQVTAHARHADLTILSQPQTDGRRAEEWRLFEMVLFGAGRPVLLVPRAGRFPGTSDRILLGWDASREATRALHDALPLLSRASAVTVYTAAARGRGQHELPSADIAAHLARHGLQVEVEQGADEGLPPGDMLLARAREIGADLLVVGGYGHSRLRETVFGGVTRHLLQRMTLPVLMSH